MFDQRVASASEATSGLLDNKDAPTVLSSTAWAMPCTEKRIELEAVVPPDTSQ